MSRISENAVSIELLPDAAGAVHPDKLIIKTVYVMAYIEDINKLFLKLEKAGTTLAMYIATLHGNNEEFSYHKLFVERFNQYLVENGNEPYHRMSCDRAMRQLREYGFILKLRHGLYVVNPKFFYQGEPRLRNKLTQDLLSMAMAYEPINIKSYNEVTK